MAASTRALAAAAMVTAAMAGGGCRSCADEGKAAGDAGVAQPTMPTGMLMAKPAESAEAGARVGAGAGGSAGEMKVARGVKAGAWTELQTARPGDTAARAEFQHWRDDSRFVSLEAMTAMHEPFARALQGFDLFLPRLFAPPALVRLGTELDAFAQRSTGDLAATARELATLAREMAAKDQGLWVLGP